MERKALWVDTTDLIAAIESRDSDTFHALKLSKAKEFADVDPFVRQLSAPALLDFDDDPLSSIDYEAGGFQRQLSCPADDLAYGADDSSYPLVKCYLRLLLEGFLEPSFQCELQKLLVKARVSKAPGQISRGSSKVVPGRCKLCEQIEKEAAGLSGIPVSSEAGAWKMVARFVHEENILTQLSAIDELLALPQNSYFKAVLDCANN